MEQCVEISTGIYRVIQFIVIGYWYVPACRPDDTGSSTTAGARPCAPFPQRDTIDGRVWPPFGMASSGSTFGVRDTPPAD